LPLNVKSVVELVLRHNSWRRFETINLIASENVMSPLAEAVYVSDMMHRYAEGKPKKRYYQGSLYVDEVELLVQRYMSELLCVKFVEPRAISGTIANAIAFTSVAKAGDKATISTIQAGAHISHTREGVLGALGIEHIEMPFDLETWNIDIDSSRKIIENIRPKLVVLGASAYLFPHPTKAIAEIAHSVGAVVIHDVAHVLGLIAGKKWPNPVHEGADIVTSSTHKTFPGPQGGLLYTDDPQLYKLISKNVLKFVSNHHLHRLPALAVTALEMMYFGEAYAEQIVRNAKRFAESLAEEGFNVVAEHLGYTSSHIVLVDIRKHYPAAKAAKLLEEANIIANKNLLPWDSLDPENPSGLRFGVQEMTRLGMKEEDFAEVAKLIREILIDRKDVDEIRKKVIDFRKQFTSVHYGFKLPEELYSDLLISFRL